jgi:hypothetical protein
LAGSSSSSSSSGSSSGDEGSMSIVHSIAQAVPFASRRLQQAPPLNVTVNFLVTFVQPNSSSTQVVPLPAAPGDLVLVPNSVLQDLRQGRLSQQPQAHAAAIQQLSSVQPGSILAGAAQQTLSGRTTDVTAQVWALNATSTITSAYLTSTGNAWPPSTSSGVTQTNSSSMQHAGQGPFGSGVPCSTSTGQCGGEGRCHMTEIPCAGMPSESACLLVVPHLLHLTLAHALRRSSPLECEHACTINFPLDMAGCHRYALPYTLPCFLLASVLCAVFAPPPPDVYPALEVGSSDTGSELQQYFMIECS